MKQTLLATVLAVRLYRRPMAETWQSRTTNSDAAALAGGWFLFPTPETSRLTARCYSLASWAMSTAPARWRPVATARIAPTMPLRDLAHPALWSEHGNHGKYLKEIH